MAFAPDGEPSARLPPDPPDGRFAPGRNSSDATLRRVSRLYRPAVVWLPCLFGASVFAIPARAAPVRLALGRNRVSLHRARGWLTGPVRRPAPS
jgi:hypothetical protein